MMNEKFWQNNVSQDEIVYYNACTRNILVLHNTELTIVSRYVIYLWWQNSQYCGSCHIDYSLCKESVNFTECDFTVRVCVCGILWLVCMCNGAHNPTSLMLWDVPEDYNMHLKQQHI